MSDSWKELDVSKLRLAVLAVFLFSLASCVSLKAPERINVNTESHPGARRVSTAQVPPTRSHEEARARLREAYDRIEYLERENRELERDKAKLKRERDKYEDRYDDLKDRYDD